MKKHLTLILILAMALQANTIYVNQQNKPEKADGRSWSTAYKNLNKALYTAKSGDEIWVAKGEYILKPTRIKEVNIYGGFSGTETELPQREIVNNETKIYGRLALQNALLSSVTILEEPERHRVVEINFNNKQKTTDFSPNRKKLAKERERRHQRDVQDERNRLQVISDEDTTAQERKPDSNMNQKLVRPREKRSERNRQGPPRPEEVMEKFDTNDDGKISKAEAPSKMKRDWNRLDKNGDGYVEEKEITPPNQGQRRPPRQERR